MANLRHWCFIVKNLKRAERFYVKNFGLEVLKRDTLKGSYPAKALGIPDLRLKYSKLKDSQGRVLELIESNKPLRPHLAFSVTDLDGLHAKLSKSIKFMSTPFIAPDSGFKVCHCLDLDNNDIELVEE